MGELEKAHLDYNKRRNEITSKLTTLKENTGNMVVQKWLEQAIDFINEKEI